MIKHFLTGKPNNEKITKRTGIPGRKVVPGRGVCLYVREPRVDFDCRGAVGCGADSARTESSP